MLKKAEYIGVDIGQYAIKLAQVKKSGRSFVSNFLAYEVIPEDIREDKNRNQLKDFVSNVLKLHKITKGTPVIHIGSGDTIMRSVVVPAGTPESGLEGAIELDLAPALPFGIDQVYFDFDETPDSSGAHLAVAARRDLIDGKTELFEGKAKTLMNPQVDVDVFAYERLIETLSGLGEISESTVAILDIGYKRSRVCVYQNQKYVFVREPQLGGNHVNEIIRDVYDIDLESAETRKLNEALGSEYSELVLEPYSVSLAEQINLAIDFYEASSTEAKKIEKIYVTGGGSRLKGLLPALNSRVTVPLESLTLSKYIKSSKQSGAHQDGLNHSLAIALAAEGGR